MEKARGKLIVFEGLDQSGKKTQVRLLVKRLRREGVKCVTISFPNYRTPVGKEIRAYLKGRRKYKPQAIHMLLAVNRWEVSDRLQEALINSDVVMADRYSPSNLAYGMANNLDLAWLLRLEEGLPKADRVVVIDVPVDVSFKRKKQRRDVFERNLYYLEKVREAYLELSKRYGWLVVDGTEPIQAIHEKIWKAVEEMGLLKAKG